MAEKAMTVDSETQTEIAHMETEMDNHKQEEWRRPNPADIDNSSAEINNDIRQTEQQNTAVKWKERWIFNKKKYAKLQSSDRQVGHDYDNRTEKCRYYATRNGCKRGNKCRYRHADDDNEDARHSHRQDICKYYNTKSGCNRGDKCWYLHEEDEKIRRKDSDNEDTRHCYKKRHMQVL